MVNEQSKVKARNRNQTQSVAALGENHRSSCCETGVTGVTGGRLTLLLLAEALPGVQGVAGDAVTGGANVTGGALGARKGGVSGE